MIVNFYKLLQKLNIKKGSIIVLASNTLPLNILHKKKNKKFDGNLLINIFLKYLGKNGTLLINAFNWGFCKNQEFNPKSTLSQTGSLGNLAIKRNDFLRTRNPIYSFMVAGKYSKKLYNFKHLDCFSTSSVFGFLIKQKAKYLFLNLDYKISGFPIVHVAEQSAGVNYRYIKKFSGIIINKNKKDKCHIKLYVKKTHLNINTTIDKKMDTAIENIKAIKKTSYSKIFLTSIDCDKSYNLMYRDIKLKKNEFVKTIKI